MNTRATDLANRVRAFSQDVIDYVNRVPNRNWNKPCEAEQWSVASTAYHIGAGHLAIYEMAQMVVNGDGLPQLNMDQITAMSNKQASDNAHCTKADVL